MSAAKRLHALVESMRRRGVPITSASTSSRESQRGQVISAESAAYTVRGDQSKLPGSETVDARLARMARDLQGSGVETTGMSSSRTVTQRQPDGSTVEVAHEEASYSKEK